MHRGNPQISAKSLLRVLESEKPDIIFIESDTTSVVTCKNKNVFGLEMASRLGIWRPSIEQRAVQRFVKRNKDVCIISYDTVFARKAHIKDFVGHTENIFSRLDSLFEGGFMTEQDRKRYESYLNLASFFYREIDEKDIKTINDKALVDSSRQMTKMKEMILPEFAATYIPEEKSWLKESLAFDENRNHFMGRFLLKSIAGVQSKKIIVLTGLLHKYFLLDYLHPHEHRHQFRLTSFK